VPPKPPTRPEQGPKRQRPCSTRLVRAPSARYGDKASRVCRYGDKASRVCYRTAWSLEDILSETQTEVMGPSGSRSMSTGAASTAPKKMASSDRVRRRITCMRGDGMGIHRVCLRVARAKRVLYRRKAIQSRARPASQLSEHICSHGNAMDPTMFYWHQWHVYTGERSTAIWWTVHWCRCRQRLRSDLCALVVRGSRRLN
jgi:hypothetical protein